MKTNAFVKTLISTVIAATISGSAFAHKKHGDDRIAFKLQPSPAASTCLPNAKGVVLVKSLGPVELMHVELKGLPPQTEFDFFVIQAPNSPFGLSWYQGDMETDRKGRASADFVGRFNEETFIVAPGSEVTPVVHNTDAATNPATGPVHTYHLGLWFNSPDDAAKAGCEDKVTPFNGEHNAGIQVLNTAQFQIDKGPLFFLKP